MQNETITVATGLSDKGNAEFKADLKRIIGQKFENHNYNAWVEDLLHNHNISPKSGASIEVGARYSESGNPVVIDLDPSCFTWVEIEA